MARDETFRRRTNPDQRTAPLTPYIDPGFVNRRLTETFLSAAAMTVVDRLIHELPSNIPDWQVGTRIDHIYTRVALTICLDLGVPSLGDVVAQPEPYPGQLVSSTEWLRGDASVYEAPRVVVRWIPSFATSRQVELHLSTQHIGSDTLRSQLDGHDKRLVSFIAHVVAVEGPRIVLAPLIMGAPWLTAPPEGVNFDTLFLHYDFFEHFVEDADEFQLVRGIGDDVDWSPMRHIREAAFKACLCQLLHDTPRSDWGGEQFDHSRHTCVSTGDA